MLVQVKGLQGAIGWVPIRSRSYRAEGTLQAATHSFTILSEIIHSQSVCVSRDKSTFSLETSAISVSHQGIRLDLLWGGKACPCSSCLSFMGPYLD